MIPTTPKLDCGILLLKPVIMNDITPDIEQLVDALVKGTITEEELSQLEAWAHLSEANRQYVRDVRELFFTESVLQNTTPYDVSAAIARFRHRQTASAPQEEGSTVGVATRLPLWRKIVRIAAVILLLILPVSAYYLGHQQVEKQFASVTMEAPAGSQLNLILPDGTRVRLNSGSVLRYSQGFGITDRKLVLSGEGYFEVNHNGNLPLWIQTKGMALKDLGTEFNVCNYADDEQASVALFHGSVEVTNEIRHSRPVLMAEGESLTLNKRTGELVKTRGNMDENSARGMNDLNFVDMRVADIAKQLSRSYGIRIEVTADAGNRRFYGFFNRKEDTLNKILEVMSSTDLIKYKRVKDKYVIY